MTGYRAIADYYDAEYESLEMLQHDVPLFLQQLPRRQLKILDLATGTGRSAIPLAQAGHRVVGVDYDPTMLALARRKRDSVGLDDRSLRLVRSNILRLKLSQHFDWACIFFNTFLNFTTAPQQHQLLQTIKQHLQPRGRIWIDIFNPNPEVLAQPVLENLDLNLFYVDHLERSVCRTIEVRQLPQPQLQRVIHHYDWFDPQRGRQHQQVCFDLTYIYPRELELLLQHHGFKVQSMWGDYKASPVTRTSSRIICQARLHS